MDNDVRFVSSLWKSLWHICGTKLRFASSYHPQADPAERAYRQVLEALRAAVTTVVQYDEWDRALPHITFGLNNHVSTASTYHHRDSGGVSSGSEWQHLRRQNYHSHRHGANQYHEPFKASQSLASPRIHANFPWHLRS